MAAGGEEAPKPINNPVINRPPCLTSGEKLQNRFIVENLIGQGSFGQIFRGIDLSKNNRKVAIKVEPKFINANAADGNDPRRLIIEKNVLIELRGKRHIPLIFASGKAPSNENPYYVMEFLGDNLTNLRKQKTQQKLSQSTSFRIAQQVALALENLHQIGYIHRDIKPSNCCIGMENKRRIYLVDFGMCRKWRLDDGKTRSPREKAPFRGTIRYASSRALTQQECGPTDDLIGWLYSVIELYQGHLPWAKISDPQELIRLKAEMPITALFLD
uniref:non-specific serine/threonine protein kinase n=1 Tax=Panagrolaimus superbus TaxID=310955 RepID=A0A914Y7N8_9BILA